MKKKDAEGARPQGAAAQGMSVAMQQLMLPLMVAMEATKDGLLAFVRGVRPPRQQARVRA